MINGFATTLSSGSKNMRGCVNGQCFPAINHPSYQNVSHRQSDDSKIPNPTPMDSAFLDGSSVLKHTLSAKARWHRLVQIHGPSSSITPRTENMGCVPSRPSESFYQEHFAGRPEKKTNEKQTTAKKNMQSKKDKSEPEHLDAKTEVASKDHDDSRELTYEEQVARADLRIYQEEMEAKKAEEERRIYLLHRAINGNGDWVF